MNDDIKQGLESLDGKSIEELDALSASIFTAFDDTDDVDEQRSLLAGARQVAEKKSALVAAVSKAPGEGASGDDGASADEGAAEQASESGTDDAEGSGETVTADAGQDPPADTDTGEEAGEVAETVESEATTASGEDVTEGTETTQEPAAATEGEQATTESALDPAATDSDGDGSTASESTTNSEETTVTASTATTDETNIEVADDNKPLTASTAAAPTAVTAGMDVQGISAGTQFKSAEDVGKAFVQRINAVRRSAGNDGEKHTVATIAATYPEDRVLDGNAQGNADKIGAVLEDANRRVTDEQTKAVTASGAFEDQALTASGGFCAPLPVRYDIFGIGVASRPVRDSLMMFNANRGGVRFVTPPVLSDLADAVGLWTSTTDATPGTATKAELKVTCAAEQDAEIDAVTLQLEFGNFMTRAYPELVNRNNELGMIQHARFAEQELLSKMANLSTEVTAASKLGVGLDFLNSIARAGSAYRNRNRMPRNTPLRVIAPDWVLDAMRTDLSQRISGDNTIALADAMITQFLNRQNVRVTWHLDGTFAAQSDSSPLVEYPTTFEWHLFAEGSFLYLDGGTLDIGVVRDSDLVGTNDYKTFYESFEGVAMVGVEALVVTQDSVIEGATVGTIAPSGS